MPELLTQPLIFGTGMAFIGLAPGACYATVPESSGPTKRKVMTTLYAASAVTSAAHITIQTEDGGQNGG